MKTLTIKDLARSEQLDPTAMAAVRGGWQMSTTSHAPGPTPGPTPGNMNMTRNYDSSIEATQNLMQVQKVLNATATGSAFMHGVDVHNKVSQQGENLIFA
jgi:hypothetical protein